MKRLVALSLLVPVVVSGCSLFSSFLDGAIDAAGNKAGSVIGDRVGTAIAGSAQRYYMTPELSQAYAMGLFSMLYYYGGYTWQGKAYKPGEFTVWEGSDLSQGERFEKAFLKKEADGKEWWRVRSSKRDGSEEAIVEALFSLADKSGTQQIVRMRAQFPGQEGLSEVPITEENRGQWVLRPSARLTAESLKGATVGIETVKVPAGTFKARHVRYAQGSGSFDWWLSDDVPGGVVKYSVTSDDDGRVETGVMQLSQVGAAARMLGK